MAKNDTPAVAPEVPAEPEQKAATGQKIETRTFEIVDNTDAPKAAVNTAGKESKPRKLSNGMTVVDYN